MVAVDDERKPVAVPPLHPCTPGERRHHVSAELRNNLRHEFGKPLLQRAARFHMLR
jgi:acyl-CoA hydrolase